MRRIATATMLFAAILAPIHGAASPSTRVVIERYGPANEAPHMITCGVPGAPPYAGFGYARITFAVEAGERSVDIAINDDFHDLPVMAFVSQSTAMDPGRPGIWICGSRNGIPISFGSPVQVTLMQAVTAPPVRGSVRAAFHEHAADR